MKQEEFSLALNTLFPGCDPEAASNWAKFAAECVEQEEYAYFVHLEEHTTDAVEKWLDATYAGLYAVMREHSPEIAAKVADLSCYPCALYPGEMMQAAEVLKNGGDADEINRMIDDSELEAKEPFFFDLPDGAALTRQGPESKIFSRFGISCSLFQSQKEPGYELLDGGTVLLESKRDSFGRYLGGVEKDGSFLPTGRLYAPVCSEKGDVRAFQEVKPVTAWEREAAFLAGEGNAIAIYRMKATPPSEDSVPLEQLQKSGESPIKGNYDLIHVFPLDPDDTSGTAVNICWSVIYRRERRNPAP